MVRYLRTLSAALALALLVDVFGLVPARAADTTPVEVPVILGLTGPVAFYGTALQKGLDMLAAQTNRQGGINGRPIKFVYYDNQSNPQVDNQLMSQQLIKNPNIIMDLGSLASCLAAMALLKSDGPVLFCGTAAAHPAPGGFAYAVAPTTIDQYAIAIRYLHMKGITKIALFSTLDAVGQETDKEVDAIAQLPENRSLTITNHEHMQISDLSVTAQLERIKAAGAQAILAGMSGSPFGTVLRGLRDDALAIPIISSAANLSFKQNESFANQMPPGDLLVLGFPAYAPELVTSAPVRAQVNALFGEMKANGLSKPEVGYVFAWDTGNLAIDALRKRGVNATPAQLRDYLDSLSSFPGVFGTLDFKRYPQIGASKDWVFVLKWGPVGDRFIGMSKAGGEPLARPR